MMELWAKEFLLSGVSKDELNARFPNYDLIRQMERYGILKFMEQNEEYLKGRVLDFGSGTQPYKHLVSGEYVPFEKGGRVSGLFDCIICNQVMQYIQDPYNIIRGFWNILNNEGHLVMTYATNWDEVEVEDHIRFTKAGMTHILEHCNFNIIKHERRSQVRINNFCFPLGYGVIAKKFTA